MQPLRLHCLLNAVIMNDCFPKISAFLFVAAAQLCFFSAFCQSVKRPPITGIAFVEVQVSDIKKANTFYGSLLGYSVLWNSTGHNATIHINQRQSIQLQDGLPPDRDERLMSLAFQTTDAEAMRGYLQTKGIVVPASVRKETNGMLSFSVTDPDKHLLRFVQYGSNGNGQTLVISNKDAVSRRILHAGLTIADTAAAGSFYRDILGFGEIWRGGTNDSTTSWINMRVPEGTDYLEYMLVNGAVSRQQLGSLHHIALMVPNMQDAVDMLTPRSQATSYPVAPPRVGRNNRWQLNLFDSDGTRIELMEPFTMR